MATWGVALWGCGLRETGESRPNIVLYVIDTLRADRLGAYGYARHTSPTIDRLAGQGVLFERAHSPAPWTLPSVVSILTSLPPCAHDVVVDGRRLSPRIPTWAARLHAAGYVTTSFYANPYAGAASGLDQGFDHAAEAAPLGKGVALWLRSRPPGPFFLYLHSVEPHNPYQAPPVSAASAAIPRVSRRVLKKVNQLLGEYRALTRTDWSAGRPPGTTDTSREQEVVMDQLQRRRAAVRNLYDASILRADENLGSVIEAIQEAGVWDDTILAVTSDHGEAFGDHVGWQHDQSLYEELVRVPLVIRLPGERFAGRRVEQPVSLLDLMPTLVEAAGLAGLVEPGPGASFWPWLDGESDAAPPPVPSYRENLKKFYAPFERSRGDRNVAWLEGGWKAIWNVDPGTLELYDLGSDPHETHDRSAGEPERASAMGAAARHWLESCKPVAPAVVDAGPLDDESRRGLEALGYIE